MRARGLLASRCFYRAIFCIMLCLGLFAEPTYAIVQGSGQVIYGEGTVATPRNRELRYQENTWIAETSLPTNTTTGAQVIVKGAPTRNEMIAGTVNANGVLRVYRWNGSSWTSEWNVTVGDGTGNIPRFDVVYQAVSGTAMVFYSRNVATTNELAYRTWNGTSWSSEITYDPQRTTGVVDLVIAEARAGTNEVAFAWGDVNRDLSVDYYTGSAMAGEPPFLMDDELGRAATSSNLIQSADFDLAFEDQSGRLMLAWGNDWSMNFRYCLRTAGPSGTWGTVFQDNNFNTQGAMLKMASLPGTDYIAYVNHGNWSFVINNPNESTEGAIWNGTTWTVSSSFGSNALAVGQHDVSVGWVTSGGVSKAIFTYDKTSTAGVDYFLYDKTTNTFSTSQTFTGTPSPVGGGDKTHLFVSNPFNQAEGMLFLTDNGNDLFAKKVTFNGTTVALTSTDPSGAVMEASLPTGTITNGWLAGFDFNRFIPTQILSTDIVTSGGVSVGSPSFAFTGATASSACQTVTGTLGDATNQRIRVTNTTSTPGWTLTIAPSGGTTANWSATTDSYDFNDATNTGCNDGADTDSLAGQLTITPSSGTRVASKTGCNTTNVNLGSAASFSEGTVNSVTLASASSSAQIDCIWDVYAMPMSQKIPANKLPGSYSLPMVVTTTAS